ncbi:MAG: recombinase family protein [Chloroflexi bacterium]|nr:recombinase family protein [Chloroflexota bacterium]MBU1751538.1 recombinase family protein [Chloroflexota bacterium]
MSKRAILYARVSTEEQGEGYSLPTQLVSCRQYAEAQGYTVIAEFTDTHTGTEIDRPGLTKLYQLANKRGADVMVVHDLDRLSRVVNYQAIIEVELGRLGLEIEYVLGQYANTPEGELMKLIKAGIAQYENRQRAERSRRGKRGRAEAGYVLMTTGRAPFGYNYVTEKHKGWLVINEEQAQIVRRIYRWLIDDGLSSYAIARNLWEENILTKGDTSAVVFKKAGPAAWSPSTVRRIISNPTYKGVWHYGKTRTFRENGKKVQRRAPESEWIAVPVPAIVDEETWEQAQRCLAQNRARAKRNTKRNYLLRGMVFCPCGRRWVGRYKNPQKRAYYRCPSTESEYWRGQCEVRFSIRQEIIECDVWGKIAELILDPEQLKKAISEWRAQAEEEASQKTRRLEAIAALVADMDRKMGILLDEVLMGSFSQAIIEQKKGELATQRADLEVEAERIRDELKVTTITREQELEITRLAEEMGEVLDELTFETKRRILELLKLRVDVISRTRVMISGVISKGLFVDLSCLSAR